MPTTSKQDLAVLIDAYADAKVSKNSLLIDTMATKVRSVLDDLYAQEEETAEN